MDKTNTDGADTTILVPNAQLIADKLPATNVAIIIAYNR